jgi:hypothetical protein
MERNVKIDGACGVVLACVDGSVVVVSSIWCSACLFTLYTVCIVVWLLVMPCMQAFVYLLSYVCCLSVQTSLDFIMKSFNRYCLVGGEVT